MCPLLKICIYILYDIAENINIYSKLSILFLLGYLRVIWASAVNRQWHVSVPIHNSSGSTPPPFATAPPTWAASHSMCVIRWMAGEKQRRCLKGFSSCCCCCCCSCSWLLNCSIAVQHLNFDLNKLKANLVLYIAHAAHGIWKLYICTKPALAQFVCHNLAQGVIFDGRWW